MCHTYANPRSAGYISAGKNTMKHYTFVSLEWFHMLKTQKNMCREVCTELQKIFVLEEPETGKYVMSFENDAQSNVLQLVIYLR